MSVPFLDLKACYHEIKPEIDDAYHRVMESGHYIMGPELEAFESEFASFCGVKHAIGVGNGLEALTLGLRARGIREGDEVIVPSLTFVATWLAVSYVGATPVPVDCDPRTFTLDPAAVAKAITPRTRGIVPVHLYGQTTDMDPLMELAQKHNLFVLEDAAQSQGATYKGRPACSLGHAAATSFYPGKNLGGYGDCGAFLTSDDALADHVRCLRNYGSKVKYHHVELGVNSRLDELQAAFLRVRLRYLPEWNNRRLRIADMYAKAFAGQDLIAPHVGEWGTHVWHVYVIRVKNRDKVQAKLTEKGIQTLIHYPVAPFAQPCYESLGYKDSFPEMAKIYDEVLSIPMSPLMTDGDANEVIEAVLSSIKA